MTDAAFLELLKYAGFGLAALSAIWGTIRKTTFEDSAGHKRLTPAGYVAITMVLGGAVISAGSYGFETVIKDKDAKSKASLARAAQLEQDRREEGARLNRALDRADAADQRAAAANQRSISLAIAARQLALAQDVGRGAAANLARTGQALNQIDRVLQPVGFVQARIVWTTDREVALGPTLKAKIAEVAGWYKDGEPLPTHDLKLERGLYPRYANDALTGLTASRGSYLFPASSADGRLSDDLDFFAANLVFVAQRRGSLRIESSVHAELSELYDHGDYAFALPDEALQITYRLNAPGIEIRGEGKSDPASVSQSGRIFAVQDFDNAALVIFLPNWQYDEHPDGRRRPVQRSMRPQSLRLFISGRNYFIGSRGFRMVRMADATGWVVDRVGDFRE